jgi:S-adenosylmethionine:tRNA ribosyltransferase-isomerase
VLLAAGLQATAGEVLPDGRRIVIFDTPDVVGRLEAAGEIPLPPYIRRRSELGTVPRSQGLAWDSPSVPRSQSLAWDSPSVPRSQGLAWDSPLNDAERYQTVYAHTPGAVAAPTAGLHYTDAVFAALDAKGVRRAYLTLHVGYGTFKQVTADTLEAHTVDPEDFEFPEATATLLNDTRGAGGRIIAVGTTSTRVLETQWRDGCFVAGGGRTDTYIYPPYTFGGVDVLQTNFHLPKSSLLALVCAFAGTEFVLDAYRYAVRERFRFYSYGDCMLIV